MHGVIGAILFTLLVILRASADTQADSVNGAAATINGTYPGNVQDIGWYYTAKTSFNFTALQTKFNSADNRTVSVDVATIDQNGQGTFVRSATFYSIDQLLRAWPFDPLPVQAGTTIFIGFRNVAGLGQNATNDSGAITLPTLFDSVGDGRYGTSTVNPLAPILLLFQTDGPQPVFSTPVYLKGDVVPDHGTLGIPDDAGFHHVWLCRAIGHDETMRSGAKYASPTTKGAAGKGEGIFVNGKAVALQFGPAAARCTHGRNLQRA